MLLVAAALAAFGLAGTALAASDGDAEGVIARDEDFGVLTVVDDDDDGDDSLAGTDSGTDSFSSDVDSNDGTNSRVTSVSRGDDLSRGDLTRDRTKDGPGTSTRDRTANHTNDGSRNDTR
jgi:hypothetical protein